MIVTVASEGGGGGGASILTGEGAGGAARGSSLKSISVTRLCATTAASPAFLRMSDKLPTLVASEIF